MFNDDARVSTGFPDHRKTRLLAADLGPSAPLHLIYLWLDTSAWRPGGDLAGMSDEDIATAARWTGDAAEFIAALVNRRWLDGEPGAYRCHDWAEHQPWAVDAPRRKRSAKKAAKVRWNKGVNAGRNAKSTKRHAQRNAGRNAPLLSSPSPSLPVGDKSPTTPVSVRSRRNGKPEPEPEGFPEFYDAHPKRTDRPAALKAWVALDPDPSLKASIMAGQRHYAEYVQREGIEYRHIKTPGPWLNGRRWEDEPPKLKVQTLKPLHPNQRAQLDAVREESERHRQDLEREATKPVSLEAQAKITELVAGMKPMPRSPAKNAATEIERLRRWDHNRPRSAKAKE